MYEHNSWTVELPDWLCTKGWRIDESLRRDGVMTRFREMLGTWGEEYQRQSKMWNTWKDRRRRHFEEVVANDPQLQNQAIKPADTPDGRPWRFTDYQWADEQGQKRRISGWCPPDLDADMEPRVHVPLDFYVRSGVYDPNTGPDRMPSLQEKYVVCAVIHDTICKDREKIDPWVDTPRTDWARFLVGLVYRRFMEETAAKLNGRCQSAIEACLKDVEADLAETVAGFTVEDVTDGNGQRKIELNIVNVTMAPSTAVETSNPEGPAETTPPATTATSVTAETVTPAGAPSGGSREQGEGCTHSPDYRSVKWEGEDYHFTANQAACVQQLWEAWKNGTPDVGDATLLETVGAECSRLRDIFKRHPSWGTMIVEGETKGTHRLAKTQKI